ncbi:hypothetical protein HPB49_023799 [Dermacentor silvarum]|uniref:Uncharacterized protein n=1 Tax=Dermacentor silvarum TaxID=543639 RepID=A0ACB8DSE7_DERSI|nr:hypothetical protein HPB49_023799 [Dermacentor silvarum]
MAETRMEDEDATGLEENEEDLGWQIVTSRKSRSTRRISGDGKTTPQSQQEQGNNSKNKGPTTTTFKNPERQWDAQTGAKERSRSKSPTRSRRRSPSKGRSRSRSREVQVRFEGGKQKPGDKTTSGTAWADKVKGTVRAAESGAGQPVGDNDARIEQLIKEVTYLRKANEELTKQVVELRKNSQTSSTKVAIAKPVNNDNSQEEENSPAPKKRAISPVETTVCSALEEIKEAIKQLRDATDRTTFKVDKLWKWRVTTEKRLSKVEAQGEDDEYLPSEAESVRSLPALGILNSCIDTTSLLQKCRISLVLEPTVENARNNAKAASKLGLCLRDVLSPCSKGEHQYAKDHVVNSYTVALMAFFWHDSVTVPHVLPSTWKPRTFEFNDTDGNPTTTPASQSGAAVMLPLGALLLLLITLLGTYTELSGALQ